MLIKKNLNDEGDGESTGSADSEWSVAPTSHKIVGTRATLPCGEEKSVVTSENTDALIGGKWIHRSDQLSYDERGDVIISGTETEDEGLLVEECISNLTLSIPGTASLPSDIVSLEVSIDQCNEEGEIGDGEQTENTTNKSAPHKISDVARQGSLPLIMLLSVATACCLGVTAYVEWDRRVWRRSALRLEDELFKIKNSEKDFRRQNTSFKSPVQDEQETSRQRVHALFEGKKQAPFINFENCYVHAQASVSLGSCSNDIKDNVNSITREGVAKVIDAFGAVTTESLGAPGTAVHAVASAIRNASSTVAETISRITPPITEDLSEDVVNETAIEEAFLSFLNFTRDMIEDATSFMRNDAKRTGNEKRGEKNESPANNSTNANSSSLFDLLVYPTEGLSSEHVMNDMGEALLVLLNLTRDAIEDATSFMNDIKPAANNLEQRSSDKKPFGGTADHIKDAVGHTIESYHSMTQIAASTVSTWLDHLSDALSTDVSSPEQAQDPLA